MANISRQMKIFEIRQVFDLPEILLHLANKSSELWSSNYRGQIIPTQIDFFRRPYFGPRGFSVRKFSCPLDNDQVLLAHHSLKTRAYFNMPTGMFVLGDLKSVLEHLLIRA